MGGQELVGAETQERLSCHVVYVHAESSDTVHLCVFL